MEWMGQPRHSTESRQSTVEFETVLVLGLSEDVKPAMKAEKSSIMERDPPDW